MTPPDTARNLGTDFRRYFEVLPAMDRASLEDVFRIRHEVYIEEFKYFDERNDGRETDEFDEQSVHCLMRTSTEPQQLVGCIRLILTRPNDLSYPLPFEQSCGDLLDRSIIDPAKMDRTTIAEVSRLAVTGHYRRRKGEQKESIDFGSNDMPRFPYIPVGLYFGMIAMAHRHGIKTLFLITEERLLSHFSKLGIKIQQIGAPVEYYGERIPSMIDVDSIITGMRSFVKPLYREICREIDHAVDSHTALHH